MRKRNYVIAMVLGLIGSLALSGIASAAPTSRTIVITADKGTVDQGKKVKADKKVRKGISVDANVTEIFSGGVLAPTPPCTTPNAGCTFFPPAIRSLFDFDTQWKIDPGVLGENPCQKTVVQPLDAAAARAACPTQYVGSGAVVVRTLSGGSLNGTVSAFVGGPTLVLIHLDLPGPNPVFDGNLTDPSTLDISIVPTAGTAIENITLNVPKRGTATPSGGSKASTSKKKKAGKFFISAKCKKKKWTTVQTTTFQDGKSLSTPVVQKCKATGGKKK